jgi:hypothetical protein
MTIKRAGTNGPGLKPIHLEGGAGVPRRGRLATGPPVLLNHSFNIRLMLCGGGFGHFPAHIHVEEHAFPGLVDP